MPFLEIVTRTCGTRPGMLERNQDSLKRLADPDWTQTLVVDDQQRGVAWAVGNLRNVEATGEWVWVLDDDDVCVDVGLIGELRAAVALCANPPDVVMVKALHSKYGMLPSSGNWMRAPVCGNIGTSCYIVRRDVWNATHDAWVEKYAGDFEYIRHLWETPGLVFRWLDTVAAWYPQQSLGAGEAEAVEGRPRMMHEYTNSKVGSGGRDAR